MKAQKIDGEGHPQKRITDEILVQIGRSVLFVFAIAAVVAIVIVQFAISSSKEMELRLESEAAVHELNGFLSKYIKSAQQLAVNPDIRFVLSETKPGDDISQTEKMDMVREFLGNIVDTDPENFMTSWIADLDASVLTQSDNFTSEEGWDITGRPWYPCIDGGYTILTEPYVDTGSGKLIVSAVAPVYDAESKESLGVAGLDISLERMKEVMSSYKVGKSGYIMLFSSAGTMVYHPQEELLQKNISEINVSDILKQAVLNGEETLLRYKIDGITKYGVVSMSKETGYIAVSNLPISEYYNLLFIMIISLVAVFILGVLMIVLSIKRSASNLTKPILQLNHTARQLAQGDLDVELNITAQDEIGELGQSIGGTVSRLKEYIVYIDEISDVLADLAQGKMNIQLKNDYVGEFQKVKEALINISINMSDVMEKILHTAEQVSIGASELSNASQILAEGASTQAAAVDGLLTSTVAMEEQVQQSRTDAEVSAEATVRVTTMMEQNQDKMKSMMEAVNNIQETSQQVVGIIQTIEEIADQTNLLSLNASIEAARAGEAGKGFAVVADEIGKLALESSKAANMTRDLIGISMQEISKGNTIAKGVMTSLEESVTAVGQVNDMIRKTAESVVTQADNMEQIRAGVQEISQGVQDNSAAAQETSATSQELASQAVMLNDMVQRFELRHK